MNWLNRNRDDYPLTAEEDTTGAVKSIGYLLYLVLGSVVVITAAHAILLVVNTTRAFTATSADDGLFYVILNVIRVAFPIVVEIAAVAVGLGFIKSQWRGGQRGLGTTLEIAWFLFAAANMITFFAFERGAELQGWQHAWVQWGLPLSALIVAALTYKLLKADPNHKRANERALAAEKIKAAEENARFAVTMSDAMMTVHERRVWRETVRDLAAQGYDDDEIAFMTAHIPDLHDLADQRAAAAGQPDNAESRRSWIDGLRDKLTSSLPPAQTEVGNTTHDAVRHTTAEQAEIDDVLNEIVAGRAGQGERPNGPPVKGRPQDFR